MWICNHSVTLSRNFISYKFVFRKAKNWTLKKRRIAILFSRNLSEERQARWEKAGSGWSREVESFRGPASSGYERHIGAPVCITIRKRCALLMQRCVPSLWFASGCESLSPNRLLYVEWIPQTEFPRLRNCFFLFPRREEEEISTSEY